MSRTRVKICGITNPRDAALAVRLGADALGFILFEGSARRVTPIAAAEALRQTPAFVARVGVFVDAGRDAVYEALEEAPFDVLQFHGDESPAYCESFDRPYIKAVRGESAEHIREMAERHRTAAAILVDSFGAAGFGGTGEAFDWRVAPDIGQRLIVAGGLTPDNVAVAIETARPYAVDVSTGVEKCKGVKDETKMRGFFAAVNFAAVNSGNERG